MPYWHIGLSDGSQLTLSPGGYPIPEVFCHTVGLGEMAARGSLYSSGGELSAIYRITTALEGAAICSSNVRAPLGHTNQISRLAKTGIHF